MESGHLREIKEIEIAQLHLRYAHIRIARPKESLILAGSIERVGQITPVIAVREGVILVLLDGYLRVKALRHCGRDTAVAEIWECKEEDALVEILARSHSRRWDFWKRRPSCGSFMITTSCLKAGSPLWWDVNRAGSPRAWPFTILSLKTLWS